MLPSDGKRGRFLEASGSNDGKYPILWQTDRTHSHEPSGLLGGFWRESVIATKALEMSHFGELRRGCQSWSVRGAHFPRLPSPHRGWWELGVGDSLHSSSSREIRLSWSRISDLQCGKEEDKKCLRGGRKQTANRISYHLLSPSHSLHIMFRVFT